MINQRLLAKLLANLGCETRTCSNGQECVDLLVSLARADSSVADARFDLVLMDLEMYVLLAPLTPTSSCPAGLSWTVSVRPSESEN
jgi:CheY-like chemotaxis protein